MNDPSTSGPKGDGQAWHLDRDLCRDLLHGLLSPAEREDALSHAATCARCEGLLQEMVAERERLRATGALRSVQRGQWGLAGAEEAARGLQGEGLARRLWGYPSRAWAGLLAGLRHPRYQFATALVAAAAILLVVLWPRPGETPPAGSLYWLPTYSSEIQVRAGAMAIANEDLASGLEAYANRDLGRAVDLLRRADASGQLETVRRIYLGSALAWSGKHQQAAAVLESIPEGPVPDPWGSEARWTLYIALKETGRNTSADSLLRVLADEPVEVGERARRLLRSREPRALSAEVDPMRADAASARALR